MRNRFIHLAKSSGGYPANSPKRRQTLDPVGRCLGTVAAVAFVIVGCTTSSTQNSEPEPTTKVAESSGTGGDTAPADEVTIELGQEPDLPVNLAQDGNNAINGENQESNSLVFADENGLSEQAAEAPVIADDEIVEFDLEQTPDVPQADIAVTEAALCATVQIGRDAVVDGDEALATVQRDMLIDRAGRVSDQRLSKTLSNLSSDSPLEIGIVEEALSRCVELGFEL